MHGSGGGMGGMGGIGGGSGGLTDDKFEIPDELMPLMEAFKKEDFKAIEKFCPKPMHPVQFQVTLFSLVVCLFVCDCMPFYLSSFFFQI